MNNQDIKNASCLVGGAYRDATIITQATLNLDNEVPYNPEEVYKDTIQPLAQTILADMLKDINIIAKRLNNGRNNKHDDDNSDEEENTQDDYNEPWIIFVNKKKNGDHPHDKIEELQRIDDRFTKSKFGIWAIMDKTEWTRRVQPDLKNNGYYEQFKIKDQPKKET